MVAIDSMLRPLPERHRAALRWFQERAGEEHPWPQPIDSGGEITRLTAKPKGIYKPEWSDYALSVRQTIGGPYSDRDPVIRSDGTWSYEYFQENRNPAAKNDQFTNRALINCQRDRVPVGVMRQVSRRPSRYHVLGVALVVGWNAGYFLFEGFAPHGVCRGLGPIAQMDALIDRREAEEDTSGAFDPNSMGDARERVVASIVRRRGQSAFRTALLDAYEGRCALTGCQVTEVLEAAHITPYRGSATNHPTNGLLLRSDVHVLFDLGLIGVDPHTRRVVAARELSGTVYGQLQGRRVVEPNDKSLGPGRAALAEHLQWSELEYVDDE